MDAPAKKESSDISVVPRRVSQQLPAKSRPHVQMRGIQKGIHELRIVRKAGIDHRMLSDLGVMPQKKMHSVKISGQNCASIDSSGLFALPIVCNNHHC